MTRAGSRGLDDFSKFLTLRQGTQRIWCHSRLLDHSNGRYKDRLSCYVFVSGLVLTPFSGLFAIRKPLYLPSV